MKKNICGIKYQKEAETYLAKKSSYYSKIIDSILQKSHTKKGLSKEFKSKPAYYSQIKKLENKKIINFQDDYMSINPEFQTAINYCSFYVRIIENPKSIKFQKENELREKMKKACLELEKLLDF